MTLTTPARTALLDIAESLWSALLKMNADDVHGVTAIAMQRDHLPYGQVHNALLGVILPLVDGDTDRAARVRDLLSDNLESVAYNLDVEAEEHAHDLEDAARAEFEDDPRVGDEIAVEDLRPGMDVAMWLGNQETVTGTLTDDDGWMRLGRWIVRYPGSRPSILRARFYGWDANPSEELLPSDFAATV